MARSEKCFLGSIAYFRGEEGKVIIDVMYLLFS
jgi:hypothetical protein